MYLDFRKVSVIAILKKAGAFALALLLAAAMAVEFLVPSLAHFCLSARTADVATVAPLYAVYSPEALLTFLARLLSNNSLGIGSNYSGPFNYSEAAMLSVGILFFFSLILLLQGRFRQRIITITVSCAILLTLPLVSQLLTFNPDAQRWTYLLCLAEVILIGYALYHISRQWKEPAVQRHICRSILITFDH